MRLPITLTAAALACAFLVGCDEEEMRTQPRVNVFDESPMFFDRAGSRPWPAGTVPREPTPYEADELGRPAPRPPITMAQLRLGQERFITYCSPCHGRDGYGDGIIPRHTFPQPPSFHDDALRALTDGDIYRVITNGLGKMPPYGNQVVPVERWAVVAYIRALQRSQHATVSDAPEWGGASASNAAPSAPSSAAGGSIP